MNTDRNYLTLLLLGWNKYIEIYVRLKKKLSENLLC